MNSSPHVQVVQDYIETVPLFTQSTDLETRIERATQSTPVSRQSLDSFNLELAKLSKSLVDATGSIPNFDQRNCETVSDSPPKCADADLSG